MKFDDLLREVGEFGRYQKWVYFWSCLPAVSVGAFMLLNVIVFGVPEHRQDLSFINAHHLGNIYTCTLNNINAKLTIWSLFSIEHTRIGMYRYMVAVTLHSILYILDDSVYH